MSAYGKQQLARLEAAYSDAVKQLAEWETPPPTWRELPSELRSVLIHVYFAGRIDACTDMQKAVEVPGESV